MVTADFNEIKNVPEVPQEILVAASKGKLVVFVGAGVSRILGCPSWKEFAEKQLDYLHEKRCINYYEKENLRKFDPRKLLSVCRKLMEEKNIQLPDMGALLKGDDKKKEKNRVYEDLYSFNSIYVTTNYDDHLDQVADKDVPQKLNSSVQPSNAPMPVIKPMKSKVVYLKDDLLLSHLINGTVLHLHGSIHEPTGMIMTIVDYIKHYEPNSKASVLLEEIFKSCTVLFVGYGLEEYEVLEFIVRKSQPVKDELRHFMLYPMFRNEVNLLGLQRKYYASLGIHLVPYPLDDNGHDQLAIVISEWAKQIGPVSNPPGFYDRIKLIDEVI